MLIIKEPKDIDIKISDKKLHIEIRNGMYNNMAVRNIIVTDDSICVETEVDEIVIKDVKFVYIAPQPLMLKLSYHLGYPIVDVDSIKPVDYYAALAILLEGVNNNS